MLAVVNSRPSGDGVGYVGLLLHQALRDTHEEVRLIALDPASRGKVGHLEAARFLGRLALAQLRRPAVPVVFNHLGIARAQQALPAALRSPYAVFLHGIEIWDPELGERRKAVVRHAAVRLSNSRYTAKRVAGVHPDLGRIVPCPLALLPGEPEPTPGEVAAMASALPRGPRVTIVGRMSTSERYKGHDELLESWPAVLQVAPDARLLVIGRGDDVPRLRKRAGELGIASATTFTGFLPDVEMRAALAVCDVFAMPSRGEGFGLAYLEAMRAGLPCIGSNADAASEVIDAGRTGLVTPAGDRDALATAITTLLSNRDLRARMGEAGRERERTVFSYHRFRAETIEALAAVAYGLQSNRSTRGRGHDAPAGDS